MKSSNGLRFFLVLLTIGIVTYLAMFGSPTLGVPNEIRYGIDIKGGVYARLYPDVPSLSDITNERLDSAKLVIERRLNAKGIFDRNVFTEPENKRIVVEIPWKPGETDFNPQNTLDELGKTALLTFQEVDEELIDDEGNFKPTGKIILQGDDVKNATPQQDTQSGGMLVKLELTREAADKFAEATGRLIKKPIAIFMDGEFISAPIVQSKIVGGDPVITLVRRRSMKEAMEEAKELADTIRAGSLPFKLEAKDLRSISPILGEGALKVAVNAGIVSFIIVFLYMLFYYRLPGMLANIALFGLVMMQIFVITVTRISLTLPGIAGLILSIGMGVDANIIIFERIKEELRSGKTLRAAIDVGFKRAFSAILDANITTLITAMVLYWLGSGPIKGFAITLGLGVALSFLTAVTASRIMLKSVSSVDIAKHHWLYGA